MAAEKRESESSTQSERDAARQPDQQTQSERFVAKARETKVNPVDQIEKVAADLSKGAFDKGLENLARKDDADKPVMGADTRSQAEKFEAAARELGCDPDEDRFKDVLRKLAKPKS